MVDQDTSAPTQEEASKKRQNKDASELSATETLRWAWRQLTSMRTALFLLMFLAIAAVPGSFIPQRGVDARMVERYFTDHPTLAPIMDWFGLFSVYSSPWFSAIYILLMVSLIGCILPRAVVYFKALKARPPKAPRRFERLPAHGSFETTASPEQVMAAGRSSLKRHRIDVVDKDGAVELSAENGYLREAGNLVFHISIVVVLIGVAIGALWSYRGAIIVAEGDGFANALSQYDEFASGAMFDIDNLPPFSFTVDRVEAEFQPDGPQMGSPRMFRMTGEVTDRPGAEPREFDIQVNHPLQVDGGEVFLVGQGYAPVIRVTDPEGNVAFEDTVIFLPNDASYTSSGVVKVPDAQPEQMGFQGFFLPTAVVHGDEDASFSVFPGPMNPIIGMNMWVGDLGLDDGRPQSVYLLERANLEQVMVDEDAEEAFRISLSPGQVADLPGGGTFEFVELRRFARLQVAHTPMLWLPLTGISVGMVGLMASLLVRPRRTWIRARIEESRTVVEVAALDRVPRDELPADVEALLTQLQEQLGQDLVPEESR